jgi:thymidylate synthase (FAD)
MSNLGEKNFIYNDDKGFVQYVQHAGSDLMVVNAARASFDVCKTILDEKDSKLIDYLGKHNHTGPFEHCFITFLCNVPMFVARQHMRHRTWSYNEVSRRYTSVNLEFYEPPQFREQHQSNRQASTETAIDPVISSVEGLQQTWITKASDAVKKSNQDALKLYHQLVETGICREQARAVLPQGLYCKYYASANLLNAVKFVNLRDKPEAQHEMQLFASAIKQTLVTLFPKATEALLK